MTQILVIEDTADIRNSILDLLEAEDFEAMGAANGREGVRLARSHNFDLIICDVMMPELDGYGVLEELRQDPATANIPFIFLTAKGERTDLRLGMNLGADDYLVKPCTNTDLLEAIRARLNRVAQQNQKLKQISDRLDQLENFDPLTGLPNPSALEGEAGYLQRAIAKTDKNSRLVPFLLVGADRLGRINDAIGYSNGNLILQKLAERLADFTDKIEGAGAARLAGDEFAIVLPPVSSQELAVAIARELLKAIAQPFEIAGKSIPLTATIGIAFYPLAPSLEELRRQAGVAMGEAKREGGNRCKIYSRPIFGLETSKDLQLAADLQQAWQRKSLQVFYQPRVELRKNKIVGVGAVVRWNHPVIGLISSAKVRSLAEESGFRPELDEWALRTACQQAKTWQTSGIYLRVSCQISAKMFQDENLYKTVADILKQVGLESQFLELEIAADTVATAKNANAMASKLLALKRLGIQTTISQFGLGHTTLSYLGSLGLDNLKIESSLVANISQNAPAINALIQMAHGLKLRAVADGAGAETQVDVLKKQKCDEFQQDSDFSEQQIKSLMGKR